MVASHHALSSFLVFSFSMLWSLNSFVLASFSTQCAHKMEAICPNWLTNMRLCKRCSTVHKSMMNKLGCTIPKCPNHPQINVTPDFKPPVLPSELQWTQPKAGAPQPHIVVVVSDDQGWASIGYNSKGNILTPNMDHLAEDGIKLERYYTAWFCAPSRSSFFTGRTPTHAHHDSDHLHRSFTLLSSKLQSVGYATHLAGKWGIGGQCDWMIPTARGFNTSFGYLSAFTDHYKFTTAHAFTCNGVDLQRNGKPAYGEPGKFGEFIWLKEMQRVLEEYNHNQYTHPLFLYVGMEVAHTPYQCPQKYKDLYSHSKGNKNYKNNAAMISAGDDFLGNMTSLLKGHGIWNNTLLVFYSDNGGAVGQGSNYPLRGGKFSQFEGGVRVVGLVNGGFLPEAARHRELDGYIHVSDWYATFGHLAGFDPTDYAGEGVPGMDGLNVWPYLANKIASSPRTEILLACHDDAKALAGAFINGHWKYHIGFEYKTATWDWSDIMGKRENKTWDWNDITGKRENKAKNYWNCPKGCLYNIHDDPEERHDVAGDNPKVLKAMQEEYEKQCSTTFQADYYGGNEHACETYRKAHKGFVGPYFPQSLCS